MIKNIVGSIDFIESLRGQKATFLLALSNTDTSSIKGITQAGIPDKIYLTPTLDSEFLCLGEVRSLDGIATSLKGVPTPALITRAVHLLHPYSSLELLNLGLIQKPRLEYFKIHNFDIKASDNITSGSNIPAKEVFQKGLNFGQNYQDDNDYIILGESVPSGTTTANATALALSYDCKNLFSSSFKHNPASIKEKSISEALSNIKDTDDIFDILGKVSDNMLIFIAGFILGLNNKKKLILAGGTQMTASLLIVNSFIKSMNASFDTSNLSLCTTKWLYEDKDSDIKGLLEMLDFDINAYYADFDFSLSKKSALKLYDDGEAKEGVGAGASLVYGYLNGLSKEQITKQVEMFLE